MGLQLPYSKSQILYSIGSLQLTVGNEEDTYNYPTKLRKTKIADICL